MIERGKHHVPTRHECAIIRDCAQRSAGCKRVKLEAGERCYIGDDAEFAAKLAADPSRGWELNIALVQPGHDWDFNDTDLADHCDWSWFRRKGFHLTPDGRGIVDFYVYSLGYYGQLETNVTAYWQDGQLVAVYGTGDGCMWGKPLPNCT